MWNPIKFIFNKTKPWFSKGGKLEALYPLWEVFDTFFYTPEEVATGKCAVRDSIDFKRMMITVCIALIPCCFMACYNTGYQAYKTMSTTSVAQKIVDDKGVEKTVVAPLKSLPTDGLKNWRGLLMSCVKVGNFDLGAVPEKGTVSYFSHPIEFIVFGALYFIPIYIVTFVVGILWEVVFAIFRKEIVNEGFFVTAMLFPLTLPATIPLWIVAVSISFGVVIGKEVFGGTGRNILNPALVARAFIFFAFAGTITGDSIWVPVDGTTMATPLAAATQQGMDGISAVAASQNLTDMQYWFDCFAGFIPGSMGETSTLCCLIGAAMLIFTGIGSWRVMLSMCVGTGALAVFTYFMYSIGYTTNPAWGIYPHWHFVMGGFALGCAFMATDPVTGALTRGGQYVYGFLIGALVIVVRAMNPAYPEGVMLAILFGNLCAPMIDYVFVQANIKRRALRNV